MDKSEDLREWEEWKHSISLVPVGEPIPGEILMKFGRVDGKSPQSHITHIYSDEESPSALRTRGKTFLIRFTSSRFRERYRQQSLAEEAIKDS